MPTFRKTAQNKAVFEDRLTFTIKELELTMWRLPIIFFSFILLFSCARKGPPLSIDRINPRLTNLRATNEHQLSLQFSEEIDTTKIQKEDITIFYGSETLDIYTVYSGNSPSELLLATEKMKDTIYEISGRVLDKAGREGVFKRIFRGSAKLDTISPWVMEYAKGTGRKSFYLVFSEVVDTNSLKFSIIPKKKLLPEWKNLRHLYLRPETEFDSLHFDTTYYFFLKNISDLSGNKFGPFITSITPDTIYEPIHLKGRAFLNDSLLKSGFALLQKEEVIAITTVDKGEFTFEVRDSANYLVHIISLSHYGADSIRVGEEKVIKLQGIEVEIDSLIN